MEQEEKPKEITSLDPITLSKTPRIVARPVVESLTPRAEDSPQVVIEKVVHRSTTPREQAQPQPATPKK